jgi:hypothetical protein
VAAAQSIQKAVAAIGGHYEVLFHCQPGTVGQYTAGASPGTPTNSVVKVPVGHCRRRTRRTAAAMESRNKRQADTF